MAVIEMGAAQRVQVIRDAVTGEALTDVGGRDWLPSAGRLVIRVREDRVERHFTPVERTPIPRVIDTAQPYPGGSLGGRRWHPKFNRYIGALRPLALEEADRAQREWWREPYARQRVLAGFIARYGAERGAGRCAIALAALDRDGEALALARHGHPGWSVRSQVSAAYHFAFAKRQHGANGADSAQ